MPNGPHNGRISSTMRTILFFRGAVSQAVRFMAAMFHEKVTFSLVNMWPLLGMCPLRCRSFCSSKPSCSWKICLCVAPNVAPTCSKWTAPIGSTSHATSAAMEELVVYMQLLLCISREQLADLATTTIAQKRSQPIPDLRLITLQNKICTDVLGGRA